MQWDINQEQLSGRRHAAKPSSPLSRPEDVFLAWVMEQPAGADLSGAARAEILKLGAYHGTHPGPRRLEALFTALLQQLTAARGPASRQ